MFVGSFCWSCLVIRTQVLQENREGVLFRKGNRRKKCQEKEKEEDTEREKEKEGEREGVTGETLAIRFLEPSKRSHR